MDQEAPHVTTKAVPFHYVEGQLLVALLSRPLDQSQIWRLPDADMYNLHTSLQYLEQALRTQCGITSQNVRYREQLYTFETPSASNAPHKNTLCVTYLYLSSELLWHKGTEHIGLFPIDNLPKLSRGDQTSVAYALERLRSKALYTTLPGFLLPKEFSLNAYQQVFETLTGQVVDRRNFRKKLLNLDIFTAAKTQGTGKRGATQMYRLQHENLVVLPKSF
jgi:8-oxo-dGTP diphosphatase